MTGSVAARAAGGSGWLHTDGSSIVTSDGHPYVIKAVAWFGMETASCAPHGLWQISLDEGLAQIASFGFTTVRLPFSNDCLHATAATGIDATANPALVGASPLQVMDQFVRRARAHGLTVILDRHRPTSQAQSPLWYTDSVSEAAWLADWQLLAERYADDPTVIGVDLHNEPHGGACWGCGDPDRDWAAAATRAGNAVLAANPHLLVIVEGVEHGSDGSSTWWGGGLGDARQRPIQLSVPQRVVYSPHDYPPSVFTQPWFTGDPADLEHHWDASWGYLVTEDLAPVLLGEFGTRLQTEPDRQWLAALVDYLERDRISFAYWSFNPNSGDTGGLVGDDWRTPDNAKLAALRPLLDPAAAARRSGPGVTSPPTAQPVPTRRPSPPSTDGASPDSPRPTGPDRGPSADWRVVSAWESGYIAEITVGSATDRTGWTLRYEDRLATSVVGSWGMACAVEAGAVRCRGADWATTLPGGGTRTVGLQVATTGAPPADPRLEIG